MKKRTLKDLYTTDHLLFMGWAYADHLDKSTEWMFAYMSDLAEVDYDEAVEFVISRSYDREDWYKKNPEWLKEMYEVNQDALENL